MHLIEGPDRTVHLFDRLPVATAHEQHHLAWNGCHPPAAATLYWRHGGVAAELGERAADSVPVGWGHRSGSLPGSAAPLPFLPMSGNECAARLTAAFAALPDFGLVSAYLFGSHAEGRAHRESDVDVAVLFHWGRVASATARFEESLRLAVELAPVVGSERLDLVVLNDVPPGFGARIVTTGRRLWCADAEVDHAYRRDSQLRAADLEPWLRRTRAIKRAWLKRP